jgi:AcrR family transcriptional regulator
MYCGTNPTALLNQRQLAEALFQLMDTKPFSAISVSELCRAASVSRQTFYSLFDSKESVVTYTLSEHYCYAPGTEGENTCASLRQMCAEYGDYLRSHADFLRTLVDNDIIYLLYDSLYDTLLGCGCFLSDMSSEIRAYAADFMAGGFTSIARTYIRTGAHTDPTLLESLIYGLFNGSLLDK